MAEGRVLWLCEKQRYLSMLIPLFLLISAMLLPTIISPISANNTIVQNYMQNEEIKGTPLSDEDPRLYFYGQQDDSATPDQWESWNHASSSDSESDDYFDEINLPGQTNNGGGTRSFTFRGSTPNQFPVSIDNSKPIEGFLTLSIICQTGSCDESVSLVLIYADKNYASKRIEMGDDNGSSNTYSFSFYTSLTEIEANKTLDLRVEFQKPSGLGDGYTLYFGIDEFEMFVPAIPPEEFIVNVPENGTYVSPYSINDFSSSKVEKNSIIAPIVWFLIIIILAVLAIIFAPPIGFKILAISLLSIGLITSLTVIPIVTSFEGVSETDLGKDILTPGQLAKLSTVEGQFLDGLGDGDEFKLWIEYNEIHQKNVDLIDVTHEETRQTDLFGLGFEKYSDEFVDATPHGMETLQLFLSLLIVDPTVGNGVIITVPLVTSQIDTDGDGENETMIFPEWVLEDPHFVILEDGTTRFVVPESAIEITNVEPDWKYLPLIICSCLTIAIAGFGIWQYRKLIQSYYEELEYDEDDEGW